jgi:hypothetical protein
MMEKQKMVLFILVFFLVCFLGKSEEGNQKGNKEKFMEARGGEWWQIQDDYTYILKEPDDAYDDWRYIFRNKYSLTWHDFIYTIDKVGKYKWVFIVNTRGYLERWKYVKYGKYEDEEIKVKYGWILGTTVEDAEKRQAKPKD